MTHGNFGPISDKAYLGYLPAYLRIAADIGPYARVCEIGVYHGESLEFWQAVFPYGEIYGVDRNPESVWPKGTHSVLADQRDESLPDVLGDPFDLVVDDGSHFGTTTEITFKNLWPLVKPGGFYVIEDWYVGLQQSEIGASVYPAYEGDSMVRMVQSLICRLNSRTSEVDEITYRFGLCIVRKRAGKMAEQLPTYS